MTTKNHAAVTLGRLGGQATSPAKAQSSRENGKKGGRPKMTAAELEARHAEARKNPPAYAVRKQLREATLKVGRE